MAGELNGASLTVALDDDSWNDALLAELQVNMTHDT